MVSLRAFALAASCAFAGMAMVSLVGCNSGGAASGSQTVASEAKDSQKGNPANPLTIARSGPYPKAVPDESEFHFDAMVVGGKGEHTFHIRNEGEVPLKIEKGGSTCKCTLGELKDGEIAPGESAEIQVSWKMPKATENFKHSVRIWTNDPENEEVKFSVAGTVTELLTLDPPSSWVAENISDDEPTVLSGQLHTRFLDTFDIVEATANNPDVLSASTKPMTAEELEAVGAKSGYTITVTIQPTMPIGRFMESVAIKTTAVHPFGKERTDMELPSDGTESPEESKPDEALIETYDDPVTFTFFVEGNRVGPVQFLPTPGLVWYGQSLGLMLGEFKAEKGKKAKVNMFVKGDMEIVSIESDPTFLKLDIEKDKSFGAEGKHRFILTFEVPPGSPPDVRSYGNTGRITVKTTHPKAKEFTFKVGFTSLQ